MVREALSSLPEVSMDCKLLVPTLEEEKLRKSSTASASNEDRCSSLDRLMCQIVDSLQPQVIFVFFFLTNCIHFQYGKFIYVYKKNVGTEFVKELITFVLTSAMSSAGVTRQEQFLDKLGHLINFIYFPVYLYMKCVCIKGLYEMHSL